LSLCRESEMPSHVVRGNIDIPAQPSKDRVTRHHLKVV
jgi:hypothetical protein